MNSLRFFCGRIALALCSLLSLGAAEPELHPRAGLPHLAAHLAAGDSLRVAYLGGSITAASNGWRSLTTDYLRQQYPRLSIVEIDAGLPGTGSNLGVCRVGYDVLRHPLDLLFVEFAVNDHHAPPELIERTMEGIVRQARRANPAMDIWFVYTLSQPGLSDLEAGHFQMSAQVMESVAEHYGIPSLHFGVDVARRVADGRLLFQPAAAGTGASPAPTASNLPVFSLDGVHPTADGHQLYFAAIKRSLPALLGVRPASPGATALPAPLHADNWEFATVRVMNDVARLGEWTPVPSNDPNLRGSTKALLPPAWRTGTPGAAIEFEFHGRKFGLVGIGAPDSGEFRVTVDRLPPVTDTFFDSFVSPIFCRQREWFFPTELDDGPHHVRVELTSGAPDKLSIKAKSGRPAEDSAPYQLNRLTLCGALVVGSKAP